MKQFNVQLKVIINFKDRGLFYSFISILAAPKITKKPIDTEVLLHTDAVFTVNIAGSPKPHVKW